MKKMFVFVLIVCMFMPVLYACNNNKVSVTYLHLSENNSIETLPEDKQIALDINSVFTGFDGNQHIVPVEYRIYTTETEFFNIYPGYKIKENTVIHIVWDVAEDGLAYKNFEDIILKLKKLEDISNKYNIEKNSTKDATVRALQYIRQTRYAGLAWNIVAGSMESDFSSYVQQNQGELNIQSLQTIQNFIAPKTNDEIDFVHMLAVVNVILNGDLTNNAYNDLSSWGVDMCQLAIQLKSTGLTGEELQSESDKMFNSTTSTFSCYDVLANSDAYNISKIYVEYEESSIAATFEKYYKYANFSKRNDGFLKTAFPQIYENEKINISIDDFTNIVVQRINSNNLINIWCNTQGTNLSLLQPEINAAARSFTKYYLN